MTGRGLSLVAIALASACFVVRLGAPRWGEPAPAYLFDERYTAFTAHRLAIGDPVVFDIAPRHVAYANPAAGNDLTALARVEWSHPLGAPLAMVPLIWLFGFGAIAVRACAVIAAVVALLATRALAGPRDALCAVVLLAGDGMFFVFARTAMPHMMLTAAIAGGAALLARAIACPDHARRYLVAAGLALGYACSVRWTAAPVAAALVGAVAMSSDGRAARLGSRLWLVAAAALAAYLATFVPYLAAGHGIRDLLALHRHMLWFHEHMVPGYPQSTAFYMWPWQLHPIVFAAGVADGERWTVELVGNRLLWWAMVPALVLVVARAVGRARARTFGDLAPLAALVGVWLPWAIVGRFGFAYYLLPALPFISIAVARLVGAPRPRWLRPLVLVLSLAAFAAAYPVLAAVPLR